MSAIDRRRRKLSDAECREILSRADHGVLALREPNDYPYLTPMNHILDGNRLLFHCQSGSHKLDLIAMNPKASFLVIDHNEARPEYYTTEYRYLTVHGRIKVLALDCERFEAIEKFVSHFLPDKGVEEHFHDIKNHWDKIVVLALEISELDGLECLLLEDAD